MATRVNLMKLLEEIRGYADMATQRPISGTLYMLPQPRYFGPPIFRRRVPIKVVHQDSVSQPVRVTVIQSQRI